MTPKKTTKRRVKDSVFVDLFSDVSYVFQLYRDLHPEDLEAQVRDIDVRTIRSTFVNTLYNDLGFVVNGKLVLLLEAQSVWDPNLPLRMLFYLSDTYKRYIDEKGGNLHSRRRLKLPKAELYVVYTGGKKVPKAVTFKETYFEIAGSLDLEIKVLKGVDVATIYGQYIGLCKVYDEQRKIYGDGEECAKETIRICIEKGYLVPYLKARKTEVISMLEELFDEELLRERQLREEKRASLKKGRKQGLVRGIKKGIEQGIERGIEKGIEQGIEKGRKEERALIINQLLQAGFAPEAVSQALNLEGGLPSAN